MLLQAIISQSFNQEEFVFSEYTGFPTLFDSGRYGRIVAPKSVFHLGATYVTGRKSNPNRDPLLIRYLAGTIDIIQVGVIDFFDNLYHQNPAILIIDNYIYIIAVNGHGREMKIWKSDTLDMMDGFTLLYEKAGDYGYCCPYLLADNSIIIYTRSTGGSDTYSLLYLKSPAGDYTSLTDVYVTTAQFGTYGYRHYPSSIKHYGTNTYHYFGISLRRESGEIYFAQIIFKTLDFETYYNVDESFSKDVTVDPIDTTELNDYYTIIGDTSNDSVYVGTQSTIVLNDVLYGSGIVGGVWKFFKIVAGVTTFYDCDLPDLPLTNNFEYHIDMYWNGSNLVIYSRGSVYTSDLNFSNVTFQFTNYATGELTGINLVQPPENYNEINADYMLAGSNLELGVFPYIITDNKFH